MLCNEHEVVRSQSSSLTSRKSLLGKDDASMLDHLINIKKLASSRLCATAIAPHDGMCSKIDGTSRELPGASYYCDDVVYFDVREGSIYRMVRPK